MDQHFKSFVANRSVATLAAMVDQHADVMNDKLVPLIQHLLMRVEALEAKVEQLSPDLTPAVSIRELEDS